MLQQLSIHLRHTFLGGSWSVCRILNGIPVTQLESDGVFNLAHVNVDRPWTAGLGGNSVPAVTKQVRRVQVAQPRLDGLAHHLNNDYTIHSCLLHNYYM